MQFARIHAPIAALSPTPGPQTSPPGAHFSMHVLHGSPNPAVHSFCLIGFCCVGCWLTWPAWATVGGEEPGGRFAVQPLMMTTSTKRRGRSTREPPGSAMFLGHM